jgi:hypothetical protein
MELLALVIPSLFVGYLAGRSMARGQVFTQIYGMDFLSIEQKEQVRNVLIYRSGK